MNTKIQIKSNKYDHGYSENSISVEIVKTEIYSRKLNDYMASVHISNEQAFEIGILTDDGEQSGIFEIEFSHLKKENPELELIHRQYKEYDFDEWKILVKRGLNNLGLTLDDCRDINLEDHFEEFNSPSEAIHNLMN